MAYEQWRTHGGRGELGVNLPIDDLNKNTSLFETIRLFSY